MKESDFLFGLLCGFVLAGTIGYLLAQISKERIKAGAENRPMAIMTGKTPADVRRSSQGAAATIFGLILVLVLVILLGLGAVYLILQMGIEHL
jgi:hypothetical protein